MEEPATVVMVPARQSTQVSTEEAPVAAEYLPTVQLPVNVEAPDADEYLPATQFRHVRIDVSPLVAEYLPASHERHTLAPSLEYVPAAHVVHVLELSPEYLPATHVKHALDPELEYWPAAHTTQKSDEDAHRLPEYFPPAQLIQTEEPVVSLNVPASQAWQVESEVAPFVEENMPVLHGEHTAVPPEASK